MDWGSFSMRNNGFSVNGKIYKINYRSIDIKIEDAAKTLGASPLKVFQYNSSISIPGILVVQL